MAGGREADWKFMATTGIRDAVQAVETSGGTKAVAPGAPRLWAQVQPAIDAAHVPSYTIAWLRGRRMLYAIKTRVVLLGRSTAVRVCVCVCVPPVFAYILCWVLILLHCLLV